MTSTVAIRHQEQRAIDNADQVELTAILADSAVTNEGVRDEQISGETDDFGSHGDDVIRFEREDNVLDDEVGGVRDEILRRSKMMGAAYPFVLSGNLLQYRPSASAFYEYCLGICFAPSITRRPYVKLPRSFERFSALIVEKHLGPSWQHFHIGAPRDRVNGTTFLKAAERLSSRSSSGREWIYDAAANFGIPPKRGGDEGMDFVVWRPALDGRIGQIFVVGQCACGGDWDTKFDDLRVKRLESFFRPPTHVEFVRSFATPFMLSDGNFLVAHRDAGWVLDRARLTLMAHEIVNDAAYVGIVPTLRSLFSLAQPKSTAPVTTDVAT